MEITTGFWVSGLSSKPHPEWDLNPQPLLESTRNSMSQIAQLVELVWVDVQRSWVPSLGKVFELHPLTQKQVVITISDQNEGDLPKFSGMLPSRLLGSFTCDVGMIYFQEDHSVIRKWILLSNNENEHHQHNHGAGSAGGFVQITAVVLGKNYFRSMICAPQQGWNERVGEKTIFPIRLYPFCWELTTKSTPSFRRHLFLLECWLRAKGHWKST